MNRQTIDRVVTVLGKALSPDTLARVLDNLMCCDAQPTLTDDDVRLGELLFDELARRNPDAVVAAQNLWEPRSNS